MLTQTEARRLIALGWIAHNVEPRVVRRAREMAYDVMTFEEVCRMIWEMVR